MKLPLVWLVVAAALTAPAATATPPPVASALQITSGPQTGSCFVVADAGAEGKPGGIVRALVETLARELDVLYGYMQQVYDSAFVSTDSGGALSGTLTLVELAATPRVLAQADVSVHDQGIGKLAVESSVRAEEAHQLPELGACLRVRLRGSTGFDRD